MLTFYKCKNKNKTVNSNGNESCKYWNCKSMNDVLPSKMVGLNKKFCLNCYSFTDK